MPGASCTSYLKWIRSVLNPDPQQALTITAEYRILKHDGSADKATESYLCCTESIFRWMVCLLEDFYTLGVYVCVCGTERETDLFDNKTEMQTVGFFIRKSVFLYSEQIIIHNNYLQKLFPHTVTTTTYPICMTHPMCVITDTIKAP